MHYSKKEGELKKREEVKVRESEKGNNLKQRLKCGVFVGIKVFCACTNTYTHSTQLCN